MSETARVEELAPRRLHQLGYTPPWQWGIKQTGVPSCQSQSSVLCGPGRLRLYRHFGDCQPAT